MIDHLAGRQQLVGGVPASNGEAELGLYPVAAGARREVADSSVAVVEAASLNELPVGEEGTGGAPGVSEDGEGADGAVSGVELDGVGRAVGGEGLVVGVAAAAAGGEGDVGGAIVGAVEGDDRSCCWAAKPCALQIFRCSSSPASILLAEIVRLDRRQTRRRKGRGLSLS